VLKLINSETSIHSPVATRFQDIRLDRDTRSTRLLYGILFLWGAALAVLIVALIGSYGFNTPNTRYYLLPWCVATGVVIAAPSVWLMYRREFNPFHPLVFAGWSYFFPAFVVGGLLLACGFTEPYFVAFVQDERYNLPLTLVYVMIGYGCLSIGFALPWAARAGGWFSRKLPAWHLNDKEVPVPSIMLMSIGAVIVVISFIQGLFGYQKAEEVPTYEGILFLVSLFWAEGSFLLWLYIFRRQGLSRYLLAGSLVLVTLVRSVIRGDRYSLVQAVIVIAFAYVFAMGRLKAKQYVAGVVMIAMAVLAGMIYGTSFRNIKGNEQQTDPTEYLAAVGTTLTTLSGQDVSTSLSVGGSALAERLDAVSSLAVVVSNYEALAPYEESWGIRNNILIDSVTFFIPRIFWPDKPIAIESSKYGDLYFNYDENAFLITPMGDLLRNFGPVGVPIGMLMLGMMLRLLYSTLIEGVAVSYWRTAVYFMLLTAISYESTFGYIVPYLFKIGIAAIVGILLLMIVSRAMRKLRTRL
jgi:hypothetical protein